jgi:hypothetical protein
MDIDKENILNDLGFNEITDSISNKVILTVCDLSILGKKFTEKEKILDIKKTYFGDNRINYDKFVEKKKKAYMIHAIGEKSIQTLLTLNIIKGRNISYISKIPYTMVILKDN